MWPVTIETSEGGLSLNRPVQLNGQMFALQRFRHGTGPRFESNDLMAIVDQDVEVLQKVLAEDASHLRREGHGF